MKTKMVKCTKCKRWLKTLYIRDKTKYKKVGKICLYCNE